MQTFSVGQQIVCVRFGFLSNGSFDVILISGHIISHDETCICYKSDKGKIEFSEPKYVVTTAREAFKVIKDHDIGIENFRYHIVAIGRKQESIGIRPTMTFDDLEHNPYWLNLLEVLNLQHN